MAKLKKSFSGQGGNKLPSLVSAGSTAAGSSGRSTPKDAAMRILNPAATGSVTQAVNFGTLHTKASASSSSSNWTGLLSAASGGGVSSIFGGGLLSSGVLGVVGSLLSLFGGKSTPSAPVAFESPVSQQNSLNITSPGAASSVSLGVHPTLTASGQSSGIYQQTGPVNDIHTQSTQVVQIVKQALLTSSSLNDVISEI